MFEQLRPHVLRLLRVPHDPDPPTGAPGSLLVFRAGKNYYKLRLWRWALGQIGALVGIIVSLWGLNWIEEQAKLARTVPPPAIAQETKAAPSPDPSVAPPVADPNAKPAKAKAKKPRVDDKERARQVLRRVADKSPSWLFGALRFFEWLGVLVYLMQIPLTYALARLDYELRWYMVTDRSLRIRTGLASVLESTMSFANVQQVQVSQGPLQRLLGLADVRVQSAGGGGGSEADPRHGAGESLHTGVFHGVDNAPQIRDLILERLRLFREAGLGDPEDVTPPPRVTEQNVGADSLAAAHALLDEARALRQTVTRT